jgi:molybdopterin adenylyltransferase
MVKIGVINVSDRASQGVYEDIPGKEAVRLLRKYLITEFEPVYQVIPDEQDQIEGALKFMADEAGCCLVVTTGGTGPALRDVTPEAMRAESLKIVPTAILSRQTAGTRGQCLIVNMPGKPKAIEECLQVIFPAIPYCIDLLGGPHLETEASVMKAFRPKQK